MRRFKLAVASALVAMVATGAQATDLLVYDETYDDMMAPATTFDWDGFYAGVSGGYWAERDDISGGQFVVGGLIGVNMMASEIVLLGIEARGKFYIPNASWDGGAEFDGMGRAGVLVSQEVLLYATGGFYYYVEPGYSDLGMALGGGIEVAVTDSMSLRGEVLTFGPPFDDVEFTASALFHF